MRPFKTAKRQVTHLLRFCAFVPSSSSQTPLCHCLSHMASSGKRENSHVFKEEETCVCCMTVIDIPPSRWVSWQVFVQLLSVCVFVCVDLSLAVKWCGAVWCSVHTPEP